MVAVNVSLADELRAEIRRREARTDLLAWCLLALEAAGHVPAAHHRLLISELQKVAGGETKRLMVFMPPGSAKSTYVSVQFPVWLLTQRPDISIIAASHTADLAESFSRRIMGLIRDHGDTLGFALLSEAVAGWSVSNGGAYRAAGVGGPITGRRADLAIIDDPVKNRAVAESSLERERVWNWFSSDLRTRLRPNASIVLVMTRWHEDDLAGRLLQSQPDRWRVLKLPAVAGDNDPLGRGPGEFLWSDGPYGYAAELRAVLADYEGTGAMRDWQALYQQDPRPAEGSLFKVAQIPVIERAPPARACVRAWDLAATRALGSRGADWTVGLKLLRTETGSYVVADVVRLRGGPDEVEQAILRTAQRDGAGVPISIPQDPGQAGKSQVQNLLKMLAGYSAAPTLESGDKATRAAGVAAQVNVGNVSVVSASWTAAFLDELSGFPSGRHDDQVDALSRGFNVMVPTMRGGATFELAMRQLSRWRTELGEPPTPIAKTYQPGSMEYQRQQEEEAARLDPQNPTEPPEDMDEPPEQAA